MAQKQINVPILADCIAENKKPEYLFWVGSAGSFDDRAKKISQAFVKILEYTNTDYAVLGTEEIDTGDSAKRSGNEFLFQMQAMQIIEILNAYEVKKIVTCDPHDFNTFKNEFPELGGNYEVVHHSQLIDKLISENKLDLNKIQKSNDIITFHDPCYLGRGNGEYEAPRRIIDQITNKQTEMKRCKSRSLCCGAGGGQMFKEAEKGDLEVFELRTEDALEVNPDIIATACPFCMVMLTDGIKLKELNDEVRVLDIAEIIANYLNL